MPNAATPPRPIEVLRAGTHTDSNGVRVTITKADLQRIADTYSPTLHEAPVVVGHPAMDGPAYGWAAKFTHRDGILLAELSDVEQQFADLVNEGRYKKISLALYGPRAPGNPAPGCWYPRHVGCLGAQPPAIKGLKSVSFSGSDAGVHQFGDWSESLMVGMLRRLREWFIAQHGQDVADRVLPDGELSWANDAIVEDRVADAMASCATDPDSDETAAPAFSEPRQPAGAGADDMSAQQLAALQAQLDQTQKLLADRDAADRAREHQARQAAAVAFAEQAVGSARVPAERRDQLVALHMQLAADADGAVLTFGEGEKAVPATEVLAQLVDLIPAKVEFGEHADVANRARQAADGLSGLDDVEAQVQFGEHVQLDQGRLSLHQQVLKAQAAARAKGQPLSYQEALDKVRR